MYTVDVCVYDDICICYLNTEDTIYHQDL